jgi:hypothetical protein
LTSYNLDPSLWIAWQFDLPEKGKGMVQAFRRDRSAYETARFKLRGLNPAARYLLTDLDRGESQTVPGSELMDIGLPVTILTQPGDTVIHYTRQE